MLLGFGNWVDQVGRAVLYYKCLGFRKRYIFSVAFRYLVLKMDLVRTYHIAYFNLFDYLQQHFALVSNGHTHN